MVEVLKMGMILDANLVEAVSSKNYKEHLDEMVAKSIELKIRVVEQDEKEQSLRRILNYGHTIGHGYESAFLGELLHGEAVACGMLAVAEGKVKKCLLEALDNLGLMQRLKQIAGNCSPEQLIKVKEAILHDKKGDRDGCNVVIVEEVGSCVVKKVSMEHVLEKVDGFKR
jgi:3-dehydroquinate synthase